MDFFMSAPPGENGQTPGKRTRSTKATPKKRARTSEKTPSSSTKYNDEELDSSAEVTDRESSSSSEEEEDPYANETPDERRIRLAKSYLNKLQDEGVFSKDNEVDREIISTRLRGDALERAGKLHRLYAHSLRTWEPDASTFRTYRAHHLPVTCVALSGDDRTAYTGSKDCRIIKWDVETGKRTVYPGGRKESDDTDGHRKQVLSVAVSTDGKYCASGGMDNLIKIWDVRSNALIDTLKGHRDAVSGLCFRYGTHDLYSASYDRTLKIWNIDEMGYVDTMFGHQAQMTCVDSLRRERAVSGSYDSSARLWKIAESSQLVFQSEPSSVDAVSMMNDTSFVSGAQNGTLSWWTATKKKAVSRIERAHDGAWITSVASMRYSDLIASGSSNGVVKLWQAGDAKKGLQHLVDLPIKGYVNGLVWSKDARFLIAGVGQEHRLGRWERIKDARNSLAIIPVPAELKQA